LKDVLTRLPTQMNSRIDRGVAAAPLAARKLTTTRPTKLTE